MARTVREQWAEGWLGIALSVVSVMLGLIALAIPLAVAWHRQMGDAGWIAASAISSVLLAVFAIYLFRRSERRRTDLAPPTSLDGDVCVVFKEGELVRSSDPAALRHYVIHKGHRLAIAGYELVNRAFHPKHYSESTGISLLDPNVFKQIPEGHPLMSEQDYREVFGVQR